MGSAKKSGLKKLSMAEKQALRDKRAKRKGERSYGSGSNNRTRSQWGDPRRKDSS